MYTTGRTNNRLIFKAVLTIMLICNYFSTSQLVYAADDVIRKIREIYKHANDLVSEKKVREILLHTGPPDYGPGQQQNKKDKWYKVESSKDIRAFEDSDFKAKVYLQHEQAIKIIMLSVSEGWNNTAEYYFYPNGNTAFVFEKLDTLQGYNTDKHEPLPAGPYIVERRTYFERNGKIIQELKKGFFKSNKQEIPLKYIRTSVMTYGYYYRNFQSFPFFPIISK